jgi:PAS domain S-box-containing protein
MKWYGPTVGEESFFDEMKRFVRFGTGDEEALRGLLPHAKPQLERIADEFYDRLAEHEEAQAVFSGPEQILRLKGSLRGWMEVLLGGPWDEEYYQRRTRIGQVHVRIKLPQRYMVGAMNLLRVSLTRVAQLAFPEAAARQRTVLALCRILDIELAIMFESYREALVSEVQRFERIDKELLEERLAISEARYEEIVEKAEALISTFDASGAVLLFNRRCEEMTGLTRAQAAGKSWSELFVRPEERAAVAPLIAAALSGDRFSTYEGLVLRPDGGRHVVRWSFSTLPHATGSILCATGVDVTRERNLAAMTRRAERLAALGTMAAGLAHEIRNPLNAAHLQLTLLNRRLRRFPADTEGAAAAGDLASGEIQRLATLVEEFLHFARPQPLRSARVDLLETARTIVALTAPEAAAAGVSLRLAEGEPTPVDLDDERIKQVILNLTRNAIEAAGAGGQVEVRVRAANGFVRIEVEDDGPGLPAEAPIFEPFYTTKENGTGLGLAIVHRIVEDHGGHIDVESRPGRTLFVVAIPR